MAQAKYVLVTGDQSDEVFDSLEEVKSFIEEQELDEEGMGNARIYKVSNAYQANVSGVEIEETDL